ncbi:uncharacterized protein AB675_10856 [Cyphellophora attinorum]|uniref:DUF7702 domain-containing protein n=1 Tax=Cyphellophora attinorum TaxID=1664694 RepID=A0A0N1NZF4_9EURO|nr:uncharacterized protein AB675_10856 [Phialophora attinorum]KPI40865.1 hypothetical protein AB675_10856 [Phialophora attinorum]
MGHFTYADGIAVFQLVFFVPGLLCSIAVARRHGFRRTSGWIFLAIFCVIRIVGGAARLATLSDTTSTTPYTIALICSLLGLSPLLMCSLGLISQTYCSFLRQPYNNLFSTFVVRAVHLPAIIALILCIVGATRADTPQLIENEATVHVGIALFVVVLVMLTILAIGAWLRIHRIGKGEKALVLASLCALPFLYVRTVYALLAVFSHSEVFSLASGSTSSETTSLCMSVLEEMAVVVIYLATGLKLPLNTEGAAETREMGLADMSSDK